MLSSPRVNNPPRWKILAALTGPPSLRASPRYWVRMLLPPCHFTSLVSADLEEKSSSLLYVLTPLKNGFLWSPGPPELPAWVVHRENMSWLSFASSTSSWISIIESRMKKNISENSWEGEGRGTNSLKTRSLQHCNVVQSSGAKSPAKAGKT